MSFSTTTPTFNRFPKLPPELKLAIFDLAAREPRYIRITCVLTESIDVTPAHPRGLLDTFTGTFRATFHIPTTGVLGACKLSREAAEKRSKIAFSNCPHLQPTRLNYETDVFYLRGPNTLDAITTHDGSPIESLSAQEEVDSFKDQVRHVIIGFRHHEPTFRALSEFKSLETVIFEQKPWDDRYEFENRRDVEGRMAFHWQSNRGNALMPAISHMTTVEVEALLASS